jgi:hypothetical protein
MRKKSLGARAVLSTRLAQKGSVVRDRMSGVSRVELGESVFTPRGVIPRADAKSGDCLMRSAKGESFGRYATTWVDDACGDSLRHGLPVTTDFH